MDLAKISDDVVSVAAFDADDVVAVAVSVAADDDSMHFDSFVKSLHVAVLVDVFAE